jgi:hypothetical protein
MPALPLERPIEEAALLNPAFGALLIARTVADYQKQSGEGLPYPVAFLILPAVLHSETRDALPATTNAIMYNWLADNAALMAAFPERTRRMIGISKECILFALVHRKLALRAALLVPGDKRYPVGTQTDAATQETRDCLRGAGFLGRWLANAGTTTTILASWGVRP